MIYVVALFAVTGNDRRHGLVVIAFSSRFGGRGFDYEVALLVCDISQLDKDIAG